MLGHHKVTIISASRLSSREIKYYTYAQVQKKNNVINPLNATGSIKTSKDFFLTS